MTARLRVGCVPLPAGNVDDLIERVRLAVAGGYDTPGEIFESLVELVECDPDTEDVFAAEETAIRSQIRGFVDEAMARHREAEATFPRTTDCDRLGLVLAELEAAGILTGEDAGYT